MIDHDSFPKREDYEVPLHDPKVPKIISSPTRANFDRIGLKMNYQSELALEWLHKFYRVAAGKEISSAIIMRRAILHLARHAVALTKAKNADDISHEVNAMLREAR